MFPSIYDDTPDGRQDGPQFSGRKRHVKKPNFFLAGAPKSGTTALYRYLKDHPNIYLPDLKEPHFFATDLPHMRSTVSRDEYEELFRDAKNENAVGEASTNYIYSHDAPENILEYAPEARIIFVIRNPIEFVQSLHAHLLYKDSETIPDLEKAWEQNKARRRGRKIPSRCDTPHLLDYHSAGLFSNHLNRYRETFGPEKIKIILFDDFKSDNCQVYRRILSFLDIEYRGRETFEKHNIRRKHRFAFLRSIVQRRDFPFLNIWRKFKDFLGIDFSIVGTLRSLNTDRTTGSKLSRGFKKRLNEAFREEIHNIEEIVSRDLSHWFLEVDRNHGSG